MTDGLFTAEYIDWPGLAVGKARIAHLCHTDVKFILSKKKVQRCDWNDILTKHSKVDIVRDVYEVPSLGRIALVEAFKEEDIGRLVQNTNLQLPSERDTCTVAEWEVRDDIQLDEEKLRFALQYTFGNHSVGRSCCDVCGLNWYKGMRSASYVAQNGRTPSEDCTTSQLQRSFVDHTLLPWINKLMNALQSKALRVRKDFDPVFGNFINKVYKQMKNDRDAIASLRSIPIEPKRVLQAQNANQIQIITCTNDLGHFCCGESPICHYPCVIVCSIYTDLLS